jgi:hypothetical protein
VRQARAPSACGAHGDGRLAAIDVRQGPTTGRAHRVAPAIGGPRQGSHTSSITTVHDTTAVTTTPVTMPAVVLAGSETKPSSTTYSVPPLHLLGGVRAWR